MTMQNASWMKWTGLTVSLALLAGCVINPYVKTAAVPRNDPIAKTCKEIAKAAIGANEARNYAECVRRTMESKAGRYAWMNNGGSVLLMQMAGFAGYSGVRGGHQAQVAAFTTGGASMYGAQQYLYRKPREVIYWSGSNAIGCAIGVTQRRTVVADAAKVEFDKMVGLYASEGRQLPSLLEALEARLENPPHRTQCSAATKNDWAALKANFEDELLSAVENEARKDEIQMRVQNLIFSTQNADIDLIAITNAIRDTVNRQLALEQPDPAELGKILGALKLPALAGATSPSGQKAADVLANINVTGLNAMLSERRMGFDEAVHVCGTQADYDAISADAENISRILAVLNQRLKDMELNLDVLEQRAKSTTEDGSQLKYCTLAKTNTLMPFGLQLAQQGVQKVAEGQTLSIAIGGGVPPFSVAAMSTDSNGITAIPKDTDDGGYKIEISAVSAKKGAKSMFFASDAVGAGAVFAVEVVAK